MNTIKTVGLTVVGIFAAGLIMNAGRKNKIVEMAIKGYDA